MRAAASYLEGGPLMWMLPLNQKFMLHVNQKSDYDMMKSVSIVSIPLN